jgi:hypothetical protein
MKPLVTSPPLRNQQFRRSIEYGAEQRLHSCSLTRLTVLFGPAHQVLFGSASGPPDPHDLRKEYLSRRHLTVHHAALFSYIKTREDFVEFARVSAGLRESIHVHFVVPFSLYTDTLRIQISGKFGG